MNPLFVFNWLISIQSLILQEDLDKANLYINKFSKLMRRILESSYTSFNTVQDEVETLTLYLELEKLRSSDSFTFQIQVDQNLEQQAELPTMLLQPYVENAIIHGVARLNTKGEIVISLKKEHEALKITIDDNGIGRVASQQNKKLNTFSQKSRGTELAEEKIAMINQYFGLDLKVSIIDKYDPVGRAVGTKVVLIINFVRLNRLKTFTVDDEKLAIESLKILLKAHSAEIEVVGLAISVDQATKLLPAAKPDVVFLDVELGDGTGFELIQQLAKINFEVIFTTG